MKHFFYFLCLFFFKKNYNFDIYIVDVHVCVNFHNFNLYSRTMGDWHAQKLYSQVSQKYDKKQQQQHKNNVSVRFETFNLKLKVLRVVSVMINDLLGNPTIIYHYRQKVNEFKCLKSILPNNTVNCVNKRHL
jgi:hypothetical protein